MNPEKPLSDKVFEKTVRNYPQACGTGTGNFLSDGARDYVLGDYSNCINTFIYAYKEDRVRRIMKLYKLEEKTGAGQD